MRELTGSSINRLFCEAARLVVDEGTDVAPRGALTREVIGVSLCLTAPRRRLVSLAPTRVVNPAFAAAETAWILSGDDAPWIFTYNQRLAEFAEAGRLRGAYGPRLRRWADRVDQLDHVRHLLLTDPGTRRAVIQLYDPAQEIDNRFDVPCTLGFRFFLRDGRLDMHTTMRSQDLWLGFCYDVFTFTVLHELMAGWVGARLGTYHHHVDSLHLYAEHLPPANQLPDTVPDGDELPPLTVEWPLFATLLAQVREGTVTASHPGWASFAATMRSYRLWKYGDRDNAQFLAQQMNDALGAALRDWYRHLDESTTAQTAVRPQ